MALKPMPVGSVLNAFALIVPELNVSFFTEVVEVDWAPLPWLIKNWPLHPIGWAFTLFADKANAVINNRENLKCK